MILSDPTSQVHAPPSPRPSIAEHIGVSHSTVASNAQHGLRRTNADKRRSVTILLNDAEWSQWSDREIARRCGVSNNLVSTLRPRSLSSDDSQPRKSSDGRTINTANIGRKPAEIDLDEYEEVEGQADTVTEIINTDTGEVIENAAESEQTGATIRGAA